MRQVLFGVFGGVLAVAALFGWDYLQKRGDAEMYASLGDGLSGWLLRDAVVDIESNKLIFGFYRETMNELRGGVHRSDPAASKRECPRDHFYQLTEDSNGHFLFSKGRGCKAHT